MVDDRTVEEKMLSAIGERPFNSSRIAWSISGASCWVLKSKFPPRIGDIFTAKALRKLDGSTGVDERFSKDMFRVIDLTRGDN